MKIFRITFKRSETTDTEVDVESEHMGLAIGKALQFLQSKKYNYKIEHCSKAELISEPINIVENK